MPCWEFLWKSAACLWVKQRQFLSLAAFEASQAAPSKARASLLWERQEGDALTLASLLCPLLISSALLTQSPSFPKRRYSQKINWLQEFVYRGDICQVAHGDKWLSFLSPRTSLQVILEYILYVGIHWQQYPSFFSSKTNKQKKHHSVTSVYTSIRQS